MKFLCLVCGEIIDTCDIGLNVKIYEDGTIACAKCDSNNIIEIKEIPKRVIEV